MAKKTTSESIYAQYGITPVTPVTTRDTSGMTKSTANKIQNASANASASSDAIYKKYGITPSQAFLTQQDMAYGVQQGSLQGLAYNRAQNASKDVNRAAVSNYEKYKKTLEAARNSGDDSALKKAQADVDRTRASAIATGYRANSGDTSSKYKTAQANYDSVMANENASEEERKYAEDARKYAQDADDFYQYSKNGTGFLDDQIAQAQKKLDALNEKAREARRTHNKNKDTMSQYDGLKDQIAEAQAELDALNGRKQTFVDYDEYQTYINSDEYKEKVATDKAQYDSMEQMYGGYENAQKAYDDLVNAYNEYQASQRSYGTNLSNTKARYWGESREDYIARVNPEKASEDQKIRDYFASYGIDIDKDGDYQRGINEIQAYITQNKMNTAQEASDYAIKSKATDDPTYWEKYGLYGYINNSNPWGNREGTGTRQNSFSNYEMYDYMTDEQVSMYNYFYNTGGNEAANEYLDYIIPKLNAQKAVQQSERYRKFAEKHPILASAESVPLNLGSGIGLIATTAKGIYAKESGQAYQIDVNSVENDLSRASSTIRGTVASNIADATGSINLNADEHPVLARILNGKSLGDLYQLGMSIADSTAIGAYGKAAQIADLGQLSGVGTLLLGGSAGTQGMINALEKGATDEQAIIMGIANGTFESLFEYVSLDKVLKGQTGNFIKDFLETAFVEGSEEVSTSIANNIADIAVMASKSDIETAARNYMLDNPGCDQKEALEEAYKDAAISLMWDFIGGAISGGAHTAMIGGISSAFNYVTDPNQRALISEKNQIVKDIKYDTASITDSVKQRLQVLGETDVDSVAKAVAGSFVDEQNSKDLYVNAVKTANMDPVTRENYLNAQNRKSERKQTSYAKTIEDSTYGKQVLEELKSASSGTHNASTMWAENTGVRRTGGSNMNSKYSQVNTRTEFEWTDRTTGKKTTAHVAALTYDEKTGDVKAQLSTGSSMNFQTAKINQLPAEVKNTISQFVAEFDTEGAVNAFNNFDKAQRYYAENNDGAVLDMYNYIKSYGSVFNLGKTGVSVNAIGRSFATNVVGEDVAADAYKAGSKLGEKISKLADTLVNSNMGVAAKNGAKNVGVSVYNEGDIEGNIVDGVKILAVTEEEAREAIKGYDDLDTLGKVLKRRIILYKSATNEQGYFEGANGIRMADAIYLDINAGVSNVTNYAKRAVMLTLSHELTHDIQAGSPETYAQLKEFVKNNISSNQSQFAWDSMVKSRCKDMHLNYDDESDRSKAEDEIVADACETMLLSSKFANQIAMENANLFEKICISVNNFINSFKENFRQYAPRHIEAKLLQNQFDDLQKIWDKGLIETIRGRKVDADGNVIETEHSVSNDKGHTQLSLKTYREGGRVETERFLEKRVKDGSLTETEKNEMLSQMDAIYDMCEEFVDEYATFGEWSETEVKTDPVTGLPVFSVVKANGEYAMNLDFSLICKKRRTLDAVFNSMIEEGLMDEFEMKEGSIAAINDLIREHDFETACALCFVDSKRYRQALVADSFVEMYNPLVRSMIKDGSHADYFNFGGDNRFTPTGTGIDTMDDSELDFTEINKVMRECEKKIPDGVDEDGNPKFKDLTGTVEYKIARNLKENPQDRKYLLRGDFMSSNGFNNLNQYNKRVLGLYNSKKGAGGPKASQSDVQYLSDILHNKKFDRESAYLVGGVRVQSFSDYVSRLVFDYVQMIQDLSAKQLPAHAYTKEPLFALQFGMTGIKTNMSLVPEVVKGGVAPGLDANGNYTWKDGQSFGSTVYGGNPAFIEHCCDLIGIKYTGQDRLSAAEGYALAQVIQNTKGYDKNCGTIAVGISYEHILKMLGDDNIRMIIPYHSSSLNHIVAVMTNIDAYEDYTDSQNTRYQKTGGKLKASDNTFEFNKVLKEECHGDGRAAAQKYLDWCKEHEYIPKFEEFAWHDNYYKLLEDFTCYDSEGVASEQHDVSLTLPSEGSPLGSFKDLVKMGLEEDALLQAKQDEKVPEIIEAIKKILPGVEAGMDQKEKDLRKAENALKTAKKNYDVNIEKAQAKLKAAYDAVKRANDAYKDNPSKANEKRLENAKIRVEKAKENLKKAETNVETKAEALDKFKERFKTPSSKAQMQLKDSEYLELAKDPVKNEAVLREAVRQRAIEAGYDSPDLYHGTEQFGFTKIDFTKSDDKFSFWTTDNLRMVSTYSDGNGIRNVNEHDKKGVYHFYGKTGNLESVDANYSNWNRINEYSGKYAEDRRNIDRLISLMQDYDMEIGLDDVMNEIEDYGESFTQIVESFIQYHQEEEMEDGVESTFFTDEYVNSLMDVAAKCDEKLEAYKENPEIEDEEYGEEYRYYDVLGNVKTKRNTTRSLAKEAYDNGKDGIVIRNVFDNGGKGFERFSGDVYVYFNDDAVKSADPVTYDDAGNVIPLSQRFNSEEKDIRFQLKEDDTFYHAGDLGKSEALANMSGDRGTGHFGTGTYFVKNQEQLVGEYAKRPKEKVDFTKYNLFKVKSNDDGYDLHDFLKGVNTYSNDEIDNLPKTYGERKQIEDTFEEIVGSKQEGEDLYDKYLSGEITFDEWINAEEIAEDIDFKRNQLKSALPYAERLTSKYDVMSTIAKNIGLGYDYENGFYEWNEDSVGNVEIKDFTQDQAFERINEENIDHIIYEIENSFKDSFATRYSEGFIRWNRTADRAARILGISKENAIDLAKSVNQKITDADYTYEQSRVADSASTEFMKALGYEGVDVSGTALDNTRYGSVIYDLKGEDLARKKEIGTARFSLKDNGNLDTNGVELSYDEIERRLEHDGRAAESVEGFRRRNAEKSSYRLLRRGATNIAYDSNSRTGYASSSTGKILRRYGAEYFYYKEVEINFNGETIREKRNNPYTIGTKNPIIAIPKNLSVHQNMAAHHELYHYYNGSSERAVFDEILDKNIIKNDHYWKIFDDVLGLYINDGMIKNEYEEEYLYEEINAFVIGSLNYLGTEHIARNVLKDFDEVKNAWDNFLETKEVNKPQFQLRDNARSDVDILSEAFDDSAKTATEKRALKDFKAQVEKYHNAEADLEDAQAILDGAKRFKSKDLRTIFDKFTKEAQFRANMSPTDPVRRDELYSMFEDLANNINLARDGTEEEFEEIVQMAENIAHVMLSNAGVKTLHEENATYELVRDFTKGTIKIDDIFNAGLTAEDRRSNYPNLRLSDRKGRSLDDIWHNELSGRMPGVFDPNLTDTNARLDTLQRVLSDYAPTIENPNEDVSTNGTWDENVSDVANRLAADMMRINKATEAQNQKMSIADKRKAVSEAKTVFDRESKILHGMVQNNKDLKNVLKAESQYASEGVERSMTEEFNLEYNELTGIVSMLEQQIKQLKSNNVEEVKKAYDRGRMTGILNQGIIDAEVAKRTAESATEAQKKAVAEQLFQDSEFLNTVTKAYEKKIADAEQKIEDLRKQRDKKVEDTAQRYRDMMSRQRQGRKDTEMRHKIAGVIQELQNRLNHPNEKKYVPKEFTQMTIDLLDMVSMTDVRSYQNLARIDERISKLDPKSKKYADHLRKLLEERSKYEISAKKIREKASDLKRAYDELQNSEEYGIVYDDIVSEQLGRLATEAGKTDSMDNADFLETVYKTVRSMDHVIKNATKVKIGREEMALWEVAESMTKEARRAKAFNLKNNWTILGEKYFNDMLRPQTVFERFGGFKKNSMWSQVYNMLNEGQRAQTQVLMDLTMPFEKLVNKEDEMLKFTGRTKLGTLDRSQLVDIGLKDENGKAILITHDLMVSVYKHIMNDQNAKHLAYGGLTVPDLNDYYKQTGEKGFGQKSIHAVGVSGDMADLNARLSKAQNEIERDAIKQEIKDLQDAATAYTTEMLSRIQCKLTEFDHKWIKATSDLMDNKSKKMINTVTEQVYGIKKAEVENYYSIMTDEVYRATDFETIVRNMNLENAGFMKERINASNPMYLVGVTDVVTKQIDRTAQYCGLMPVQRAFNKIWNKGQAGYKDTLKKAVRDQFGDYGLEWVENLMADFSGSRNEKGGIIDNFFGALRGNLAQTTLTLNLRTAAAQAASYPTASAIIGHEALLKGLMDTSEVNTDLIAQYSPLWWYRMQGYSNTELGDIKNSQTATARLWKKAKWATGWIQAMDGLTTAKLWKACEYYVADNMKVSRTAENFNDEVAKVYNKVIEETQPNYTLMQRPELLRNPSAIQKTFTMFMTQRLQNVSIMADAVGRYKAYSADLKNGRNGVTEADVAQAKGKVVSAFTSQAVSTAMIVGIKFLVDAIMHNMGKYRDDDDEITKLSVRNALIDQLIDTAVGNFFLGSNVYSFLKAVTGNGTWYDVSLNGIDSMNDFVDSLVKIGQEASKEDSDPEKLKEKFIAALEDGCTMMGIPAPNAVKLVNAVKYHIEDIKNGEFLSFESDVNRTSSQNVDLLFKAYQEGDSAKVNDLIEKLGGEKDAATKLKSYMKKAYGSGTIVRSDLIKYLEKYIGMTNEDAVGTADYWELLNTNKAYSDSITMQGYRKYKSMVEASGVSVDTYIETMKKADADENGSLSQDELRSYLKQLMKASVITKEQAQAMWSTRGWKKSF